MKQHWLVAPSFVVLLITGCAVTPAPHFADHAIRINGDGDIVRVVPATRPAADPAGNPRGQAPVKFASSATQTYETPIRQIFDAAEAANRNVLIFVHGGLVSFADSTNRTNLLVQRYETDPDHLLDGYFPITLNWDSSLEDSYLEHLAFVRQGEKLSGPEWETFGILTAPLYAVADVGRSAVRAPIDVLYDAAHNIGAIPSIRNATSYPAINSNLLYSTLRIQQPNNVSKGRARTVDWQTLYKVPWNVVTFPLQSLVAPIIDGLGTPAWENMERRTKNSDNKTSEFDIEKDPRRVDAALQGLPVSVMDEFARQLVAFHKGHPSLKITLVGHSMGTFVLNDLLQRTPDVEYANIVYMAGADSIRDTFDSVLPYLLAHGQTQFYVLTLHPQAEIEESHVLGVAPRGSLLVWIDDFFSSPLAFLDRTVGRWENLIQAYGEIDQPVRARVHIKAFDQTSKIQEHGDFGSACFWQHEFWEPGPDGQDGWDKPFYDGQQGVTACIRNQ